MEKNEYVKILLKRIRETEKITGAYKNWMEYRENLTRMIKEYIDNDITNKTILIMGAGECNDIDLKILSASKVAITLSDSNIDALKQACEKYRTEDCADIKCISTDYLGLTESDYEEFLGNMIIALEKNDLEKSVSRKIIIDDILDELEKKIVIDMYGEYDYVIMIGLHSQIFNIFMRLSEIALLVVSENIKKIDSETGNIFLSEVAYCISNLNDKYIPRLNHMVLSHAKKGMILGYEDENIFIPGESIEGAYQCGVCINKMIAEGKIVLKHEVEMRWPFCESERKIYKLRLLKLDLL